MVDGARIAELEARVRALEAAVERIQRPVLWVPPHVDLGEGAHVDPRVSLWGSDTARISIGAGTRVYRGAEWNGPVTVGDGCMINRDSYIRAGTTIGDGVFLGPFVRLISDSHQIGSATRRAGANRVDPITVGDGTWIGAGVTVLGGVTIGAGCVIAAGAVVTRDVPDNTLAGGIPAKVLRALL